MEQDEIILSICIASYNNCKNICKLVNSILRCENNKLEVVVSDNCSTDGTIDELCTIRDDRLKIHKNNRNFGANYNYMSSIKNGNGKYIMFLIDKERIRSLKGINEMISILSSLDVSTGYCENGCSGMTSIKKYAKGIDSLRSVAYLSEHPSGYLFRKRDIDKLDLLNFYTKTENVGAFPFEFLIAELSVNGTGAVVMKMPIFYSVGLKTNSKVSLTYSPKNKNIYFFWNKRLKMMKLYLKHLSRLNISYTDKHKMAIMVFIRECELGSYFYKRCMSDKLICIHYCIKPKSIGMLKLFFITNIFCISLLKNTDIKGYSYKFKACLKVYYKFFSRIYEGFYGKPKEVL